MSRGSRVLLTGCVAAAVIVAAAGAGWTWAAVLTATIGLLLILRGAVDAITITGVVVVALLVWCWSAGWWHLLVPTASAGALVIIWLDDKEWKKHERERQQRVDRRGAGCGARPPAGRPGGAGRGDRRRGAAGRRA